MDKGEIAELISGVDESRLISNLSALVATPSVNPFDDPVSESCREQEFADLYQDLMDSVGLETSRRDVIPGRPNVFGRIRGSGDGACVTLAGHMDTVGIDNYDNPFTPVIKNGRLYGRGSCDMKAALAAYIEVARIIMESGVKLKNDLLIVGVCDEEHKMIGSKEISDNGPIPNFAIVGEPTELKVCHAHKGQLCMHIKTYGRASHSSVPEQGVNAISHMADVVHALKDYRIDLASRTPHPTCGHGRVNPGVIHGGTISSSVPDYCELEVDRRFLPGETPKSIINEYHQMLRPLSDSNPDFRYEIGEPVLNNAAHNTSVNSEIVKAIITAYTNVAGKAATVGTFSAATDAPNFRCPAVICGPGSINQAHTLDEYVPIDELTAAARIYLDTVLQLLC